MQVFVEAVGVLAPGMPDWAHAQAMLAGHLPFVATPLAAPAPTRLAAAERRRSSPTVRLAIAVAEQALQQTPIAAPEMAMVFSSYEAAGVITHQLCEALAGSREVSPTQFHNAVHNAPSGYYSIAMHAQLAANSVCKGPWSFAAGLLDAAANAVADQLPVLYVCYDSPLPAPLVNVMPVLESSAIALVLTPERTPRSLAGWELVLEPSPQTTAWPAWMPPSWQANASARGFSALTTLMPGAAERVALPLSPELQLRVSRC